MQALSAVISLWGPSSRGGSTVALDLISEHATSKRAGRGENIRVACASSANSPGQICIHFLPDEKTRSADVLHSSKTDSWHRESSSCQCGGAASSPTTTTTPVGRSNSSQPFGRLSSRYPPLVSDLHICVVTFQLLCCQRSYC